MSQVSYGTITITDIPSSSSTIQHFWFNPTQQGTLLAGAYITDTDIDTFKSGKSGGYLLARSDGLILGKASNRYMELEGSELKFYKSGTTDSTATIATNIAAKLSSTGLEIANGGMKAGTPGQSGFVYLSSEDYPKGTSGITINNHTPDVNDPAWREIIGTKFGVDSEGNLYASNADISGKIVATEGVIGGCVIDSEGHLSVPSAYIDGTLTVTTIEGGTFNTSDYIYLSLEDSQAISIGNSGSKIDWRIIAGNTFGVDKAGNLYSTSANISGLITAIGGSIGAWSVESPSNGTYTYGGALYTGTFGSSGGIYLTPGYTTVTNIGGSTGSSNKTWVITAGDGFGVTSDGTLYANLARIAGDVKANTGTIGGAEGWTIESQKMSSGTIGSNNSMILSTTNLSGSIAGVTISDSEMASKGWRLTVGSNFGVDNSGKVYASNAVINGNITAISGTIGGWQIGTDTNKTLHNGSENTSPTVGAGIIVLSKGLTSTTSIGGSSGSKTWAITAGTGFGVTTSGEMYVNSGVIGGCAISNGELQVSALNITSGTINSVRIPDLAISKITDLSSSLTSAANTANSYIYYSSSALKIAQSNPSSTTTNYVQISSSGVDIVKSSTYKASITSGGLKVYAGNESYDVATFGSTLRIGPSNSGNITINANSIDFNSSSYGSGTMSFSRVSGNDFLTIGGNVYQLSLVNSGGDGIEITNSNIRLCEPVVCDTPTGANSPVTLQVSNGYIKNSYGFNNTGSAATNLVISSDAHVIKRTTNTSSLRFKNSISKIQEESLKPYHLYDIEVIQYKYNDTELTDPNDPRRGVFLPGYIAEQVQKVYPIAVDIDEEGRANAVNIHFLLPGMLALIQELNQRINKLEENK